jgi:hypothetical protein
MVGEADSLPVGDSWIMGTAIPAMRRWGLAQWVVTVVIAAQLAVPFMALRQPSPTRFGFQMYSGLGGTVARVTTGSGEQAELDVSDYTTFPRGEIDWLRYLPPHLCRVYPDAAAVEVSQGADTVRRTC